MHIRRVSDDVLTATNSMNRKKLSSQFMDRINKTRDTTNHLSSTAKIDRKIINLQPVQTDVSIANIIQEKVTKLKNKFGELDDLRRKLIESRCELREDQENRKNTFERSRGRSSESTKEVNINREFNFTKPCLETNFMNSLKRENNDIELYNERKSTQKIILEKNIIERENQEKEQKLQNQIDILKLEMENIQLK